jgi:hypothetical protein
MGKRDRGGVCVRMEGSCGVGRQTVSERARKNSVVGKFGGDGEDGCWCAKESAFACDTTWMIILSVLRDEI